MLTVLTILILYNISDSIKIIVTYSFGVFLLVQSSNILHYFCTNIDYNFYIFYFFSTFPVLAVLWSLFSRCFFPFLYSSLFHADALIDHVCKYLSWRGGLPATYLPVSRMILQVDKSQMVFPRV